MRCFGLAVLYTALALLANPAAADVSAAEAARAGDMRKLTFNAEPVALPEVVLLGLDDAPRSLEDYRGKWVLVNFWATWCPPCRHEMPGLDRLQADMGGEDFAVVTVASGRNPVPAIEKFFAEESITSLPALRDPKAELSRGIAILALPVTILLNPEGREVGRLIGDAVWDGPDARAMVAALLGR